MARHDEAGDPAAAEGIWAGASGAVFQGLIPTLAASAHAQPLGPAQIFQAVAAEPPAEAAPAEEGQVCLARELLFEPDEVLDEGPMPRGRPGRPRGGGRGGLRGGRRWHRGRGARGRGRPGRAALPIVDAAGEASESESLVEASSPAESPEEDEEGDLLGEPAGEVDLGPSPEEVAGRAREAARLAAEFELFGDLGEEDEEAGLGPVLAPDAEAPPPREPVAAPLCVPDAAVQSDEEALARHGLLPAASPPPRWWKRRRVVASSDS